jgi:hypothetical protein
MSAAEGGSKKHESVDDKNKVIANRYRIEKKLSKDKNGKTFLVIDLKNNEELLALLKT